MVIWLYIVIYSLQCLIPASECYVCVPPSNGLHYFLALEREKDGVIMIPAYFI